MRRRLFNAETQSSRRERRENRSSSRFSLRLALRLCVSASNLARLLCALPAFAQCDSAKCHVGIEPMHASPAVHLTCTDCHGGRADTTDKLAAHVAPRNRALWRTAANPPRTYAALNQESPEFVRFLNPGDLRVADQTCGNRNCHGDDRRQGPHQPDEPRSVPLGRGALQ